MGEARGKCLREKFVMPQPDLMSGVQLLCIRREPLTTRLGHLRMS